LLNLFNEYDFDYIDSRKSNIVQIADIIAGSVMKRIINPESPNVLKMFRGNIRDIINFPKIIEPYISGGDAKFSFDAQIYSLANHCALSYIENNKSDDEEDVRLRILFLKQLLFTARNISVSKFLYAQEIIEQINNVSDKKINKNYLCRRVIAPLRDAGILISSSKHGYKLPTCLDDIYTYINQTNGIVSPMLSRIEKCRKSIIGYTDGKLDVCNGPVLEKYKRYFGDY